MPSKYGWAMGLGLGFGLGLGCTGASVFVCTADEDCGDGRCEPNGYCSFPSEDCESGWVYGELSAPQLAGDCVGEGEGTGDEGTTGGSAPTVSATGGVTTDEPPLDTGEVTGDTADTAVDTSSSTDPTRPTTVTTEPPTSDSDSCVPLEPTILWVEDARLYDPMQYEVASALPGQPLYAFSEQAQQGSVVLGSMNSCEEDVYAWGLVLDPIPGVSNRETDPDSFFLSLDMSPEILWEYGCAFNDLGVTWQWVPLGLVDGCPEVPDPIPLTPGDHFIQVRNHEAAGLEGHAGIAAIFIAADPGAHPEDLYPLGP